jgi:hypothetical protein
MAELRIAVAKASAVSDRPEDEVPDVTIFINKSTEDRGYDASRDAEKLAAALHKALPGGMLDLLLAYMMRRMASSLVVSRARRRGSM